MHMTMPLSFLLANCMLLTFTFATVKCLSVNHYSHHQQHEQQKTLGSRRAKDADTLNIVTNTDGSYVIYIGVTPWLGGGPAFFNADGIKYIAGLNLKLNSTTTHSGTDKFGDFQAIVFHYLANNNQFDAAVKTYEGQPFALFTQTYVNGARATRADNVNYVIGAFPSFAVVYDPTSPANGTSRSSRAGYLSFGGMMCGDTNKRLGIFTAETFRVADGLEGGPIAIFDGNKNALIISPASNFMAASSWHEHFLEGSHLHWGFMGGVESVPAGAAVDFILYYSSEGINKAFEGWGSLLRTAYGRSDEARDKDLTINYLGYWTDNGAYYYYMTEANKTYEDTMLDAKAYADQLRLPYRYWQYDSWWYYKGVGSGVKTWVSRPDIFPHGFQYVHSKIGLPASAHNRYWSSDTTYAKLNGGAYNFIVESVISVPDDQKFWDDLFANSSRWGLYTYEQDWLNKEFGGCLALLSDLQLGARWLNQMAAGAAKNNVTIQYCMSNSRHVMQALQNSVVTQARASDDYSPGDDQWKIGMSSMFAHAMGLAPFKDNFWSTTEQPFNPYNRTEPHNELQLAVSVLSTGPVGPSDMIGHANVSLIMKCCNAEGLVLKPSKPATTIDDIIYREATEAHIGDVWSTYSLVSGLLFGIIFVPEMSATQPYTVTPSMAGFSQSSARFMVFEAHAVTEIAPFSETEGLHVSSSCSRSQPCIYHATPVLKQKLLGNKRWCFTSHLVPGHKLCNVTSSSSLSWPSSSPT